MLKEAFQGLSDRNSGINGISDCAEFQIELFYIGFVSESKTGAITVATGAAVFGIDLALRLAFVVAFTLWWRRPGAASQASHLWARM